MEKIFILSNDASFTRNIDRIIDKQKYQVTTPNISVNSLYTYCCSFKPNVCIIHHSYVDGFYKVFDMLISIKKCFVVYFTSLIEIGSLYNVISSPMFYMMEEEKIFGINEVIEIMKKDTSIIFSLEEQVFKYKEKIEEERIVRKAKLAIMKYRNCSEDEAYKMILKKSMDERITKALASKKIISEVEK